MTSHSLISEQGTFQPSEAHEVESTHAAPCNAIAHCTSDFLLLLTGVPAEDSQTFGTYFA